MREIKFRAWKEEGKDMIYSHRGNFVMEFDGECSFVEWGHNYFKPMPDLILMQFTGKKDKKGKEIYEGDVLRVKEHPDFPAWGRVGFVFWDNKEQSYFYGVEDGWSDLLCTPYEKQLEVIGNIYENPELLEEQK